MDNAWTAHRFAWPSPEPAHVPRAALSIGAAPFLPADRRVADSLAEAMQYIHAQPSTATEATAGAWASAGLVLGYGFRCQYG